ncbi:MAG: hypothetical protein M3Q73_00360 [bacterium]|nr:hypothetical protein [bacterium]
MKIGKYITWRPAPWGLIWRNGLILFSMMVMALTSCMICIMTILTINLMEPKNLHLIPKALFWTWVIAIATIAAYLPFSFAVAFFMKQLDIRHIHCRWGAITFNPVSLPFTMIGYCIHGCIKFPTAVKRIYTG